MLRGAPIIHNHIIVFLPVDPMEKEKKKGKMEKKAKGRGQGGRKQRDRGRSHRCFVVVFGSGEGQKKAGWVVKLSVSP